MSRTRISVVIPCKDEEKSFPRVANTLHSQENVEEVELIAAISPDTTDRTAVVSHEYGCRIAEVGRPATAPSRACQDAPIVHTEHL